MRLIDADEAKKQINQMQTLKASEKALLRLALDRTQTYEPPSNPLTLDELREMGGRPVWITPICGGALPGYWVIIEQICENVIFYLTKKSDDDGRRCETYGKTWLAYRCKPEEV